MSDMRVVIAGAGGRMGRTLVKAVAESKGLVVAGALEPAGSPLIGQDAGELAGLGRSGVALTADADAALADADGVIDFTVPAASVALAVRLLERFGTHDRIPRRTLSPAQIARIEDYLAARVDRPTSLQELAQVVDLSPQVFHRAFKASTGLPPLRYCQQWRMRRARDLVEGSRTPIGEIATVFGFSDLAHFTNTFRKHWGVAPTRLRRG